MKWWSLRLPQEITLLSSNYNFNNKKISSWIVSFKLLHTKIRSGVPNFFQKSLTKCSMRVIRDKNTRFLQSHNEFFWYIFLQKSMTEGVLAIGDKYFHGSETCGFSTKNDRFSVTYGIHTHIWSWRINSEILKKICRCIFSAEPKEVCYYDCHYENIAALSSQTN